MLVRWLALLFPIGTNCQTGQRRVVLYTVTNPRTATAGLVHARYFEQYNAVEAKRRGGIDENDVAGTWHAQMQQDRVIARIFEDKRDGFFVDLAAHTPVDLSNTRTLERDFGWHFGGGDALKLGFDLHIWHLTDTSLWSPTLTRVSYRSCHPMWIRK